MESVEVLVPSAGLWVVGPPQPPHQIGRLFSGESNRGFLYGAGGVSHIENWGLNKYTSDEV